MRQSLSKSPSNGRLQPRGVRRTITATVLATTATSALVLVVAALDQSGTQRLYGYTEAAYATHGVPVDPSLVYSIVYAVGVTLTLLWALMIPLPMLRGWWAPCMNAAATIITGVAALLMLSSVEYGELVFSPVWGALILIPTALGAIATILLVNQARR